MKLGQKFVSIVGTLAVGLGMTAGITSAQAVDDSAMDVSVSVSCTMPNTVDISGDGTFADYDIASLGDGTTSTAENALEVEVNVGCYLGPWEVNAEITAFDGDGPLWFPGSWFSLEEGPVSAPYAPIDPDASSAEFSLAPQFGGVSENAIFETYHLFSLPYFDWSTWSWQSEDVDAIAPFVSTANFTGHLENMDAVLPGDYSAELTVELILD